MAIRERRPGLSETEAYNILRNDRRRHVLDYLRASVGDVALGDLAEWIAERETDQSPPPRSKRESVYNALHQTHLPKLDDREIVEYDERGKRVALNDTRNLHRYMNVVTDYGITWGEYYRSVGLLALLVLLAADLGAPVLSSVDSVLWVSLFLVIIAASTGYQLRAQLRLAARRLREWM
jgi:hypothetical protein